MKKCEFRTTDGRVCCGNDDHDPSLLCDECKKAHQHTQRSASSEIPDGYAIALQKRADADKQRDAADRGKRLRGQPAQVRNVTNDPPDGYAIALAKQRAEEMR